MDCSSRRRKEAGARKLPGGSRRRSPSPSRCRGWDDGSGGTCYATHARARS
jgi:hypothetical protein